MGILAKFGLSSSFPKKVEDEARAIPEKIDAKDLQKRLDHREVFTLTIDPLDARDFDDALSLQKLSDDEWEVGVHIADVSHYVKQNSALDKDAKKRGNSTYLVGEVVPMLPKKLSNGICSLVEGEDRLVKSVLFRFRDDGQLIGSKVAECVINSDKRLTYEQAILFLRGNSLEAIKAAKPPPSRYSGNPGKSLQEVPMAELKVINQRCKVMGHRHKTSNRQNENQFVNLESAEVKILVDGSQ